MSCPSGASVKGGANPNAQVVVSRSLWETFTGGSSSWLDSILDTITPSVIKVSDLCTLNVQDPADLSLTTITAAITGNPAALLDVESWCKQKLSYLAFAANCVCNPNSGIVGTCSTFTGPAATVDVSGNWLSPLISVPSTATNATFHIRGPSDTFTAAITYTIAFFNGATQLGSSATLTPAFPGDAGITSGTKPSTANGVRLYAYIPGHAPGSGSISCTSIDGSTDGILCSSTPPTTTSPTQPSDLVLPTNWACSSISDICTRLQQVSDRIDWLRRDVTLIQRQAVPFAYLVGTVHAGLTGSGTLTVQGLLGLLVQISTVPTHWGASSDFPTRYIPAPAMVSAGDAAGDQDTHFCHFAEELVFPTNMGVCTKVKYEFKPGCGGAITELVRES